jgi:hypothetical protein
LSDSDFGDVFFVFLDFFLDSCLDFGFYSFLSFCDFLCIVPDSDSDSDFGFGFGFVLDYFVWIFSPFENPRASNVVEVADDGDFYYSAILIHSNFCTHEESCSLFLVDSDFGQIVHRWLFSNW